MAIVRCEQHKETALALPPKIGSERGRLRFSTARAICKIKELSPARD